MEPDRAQHLAKTLKLGNTGQIFITTHSRDVIVELDVANLYKIIKNEKNLRKLKDSMQGTVRKNPEAFFSDKVIVCEGATEVGFCRSLNNKRLLDGKDNISLKGVRLVDGTGSEFINYCKDFVECGYEVCAFCDSDDSNINDKKQELKDIGVIPFPQGTKMKLATVGRLHCAQKGHDILLRALALLKDNFEFQLTFYGTGEDEIYLKELCVYLGLEEQAYQESRREKWDLKGVEVVIDEWPWLEPFVEVEGESEEAVREVSMILGFNWDEALFDSVDEQYSRKYGVNKSVVNKEIPRFVFGEPNPFKK